jgi:hypothetical protein
MEEEAISVINTNDSSDSNSCSIENRARKRHRKVAYQMLILNQNL